MRHTLRIGLFLCFVASSLSAQLQIGQVYVLKGASGNNLSAAPTKALKLSPNTAAWEQWQYSGDNWGGRRLISYHGTAFLIDYTGTSHQPRLLNEGNIAVITRDNGQIAIGKMTGASSPMSDGYYLADLGDSIGMVRTSPNYFTPSVLWTPVPVPSPAGGRTPELEAVSHNNARFGVLSAHGTHAGLGGVISGTGKYEVTHQAGYRKFAAVSSATGVVAGSALMYGQVVYLKGEILSLSVGGDGLLEWGSGPKWVVIDPTGQNQNSERVAFGSRVAFRHQATGQHMSADPAKPRLYLSPNTAAWEQWTIVK